MSKTLMSAAASLDDEAEAGLDWEGYRLVSIESVHAPEGCAGRDWFVYRIAQGANEITGYRSGSLARVRAEVETIVAGLNGRRSWVKGEPKTKPQRRAASNIQLGRSK
jgi:hypothetical protein